MIGDLLIKHDLQSDFQRDDRPIVCRLRVWWVSLADPRAEVVNPSRSHLQWKAWRLREAWSKTRSSVRSKPMRSVKSSMAFSHFTCKSRSRKLVSAIRSRCRGSLSDLQTAEALKPSSLLRQALDTQGTWWSFLQCALVITTDNPSTGYGPWMLIAWASCNSADKIEDWIHCSQTFWQLCGISNQTFAWQLLMATFYQKASLRSLIMGPWTSILACYQNTEALLLFREPCRYHYCWPTKICQPYSADNFCKAWQLYDSITEMASWSRW